MAPRPDGPLLMVGAGSQGRVHLEAFREVLCTGQVFVASRTGKSARELAGYARSLGAEAWAVDRPEEVLHEVSLVVTATASAEPVLPEDAFVAAVGSFRPGMAELPPGLLRRASVVVDTLEGAREEAGDLIQAAAAGAFDWSRAIDLGEVLLSSQKLRGPVVFKSVGDALWDLAAAKTAFGS
jgi:1-piperideine-2-carboxylate/1-pyrroline-2-carboxylate reductase [NAD(P)H]